MSRALALSAQRGHARICNVYFREEFAMRVFDDNSYSIGNTPLVRLHKLDKGLKAKVYGKVEGRNPA